MEKLLKREKNMKRRILVVDDEAMNRQLLGFMVSKDYDVLYAENGKEALSVIYENKGRLSLILLDLLMPVMDGYELLEVIHQDGDLRKIPVIVMTSEKSAEVRSLQLGAADFITKPYDMPEVILARVSRSIELAEDHSIIKAAENDPLTGLYTKEFFFEYCSRLDSYHPDRTMDAIVLNINRFHLINELNGRSVGDELLKCVTGYIVRLLNNDGGIACRCDADTFYFYLPCQEDYDLILREIVSEAGSIVSNARISMRMGIYRNANNDSDVLRRFDRALHACNTLRHHYHTDCAFYDNEMHEKEIYSEKLLNDMDTALSEKQFKVYYQPKYNIKGDRPTLASAEALIRWQHPDFGMVSPGAFIPLFEENGLIHKLDQFVRREAAAQIKQWKDTYGMTVPVSVNVSRVDMYDPNLESELLSIVQDNGLRPDEYLLEVTESAYTENSKQIVSTVEKLREDGFRVEMDDFGSGYSSLNMLATLPIDALKLDMAFVRHICSSEKDRKMVELMIDIADFLSVPVIAEGVETKEQYELLKASGCDIIQGYYFSKPVPPDIFNTFIEKETNKCSQSIT